MQRNVHSSVIDGLVLGGLRPAFVAPELDPELGIAHCLTAGVARRGARRAPRRGRRRRSSPPPTSAPAPTSPPSPRSAHERGAAAGRRRGLGSAPALPPRPAAADAVSAGADRRRLLDPQDRRQPHPVGDPSSRRGRPDRRERASTAASASSSRPARAACWAARSTPRGGMASVHGEELLGRDDRGAARGARPRSAAIPGLDVLDESMVGPSRASPAGTRCASRSTSAAPASTGYRLAEVARELDDINFELFAENVAVAVFGMGAPAAPQVRRLVAALRHAVERDRATSRRRSVPEFAPPPPWGELVMTPREAFLGPQEVVPFDARRGADRRRVARRLSARDPERPPRRAPDPRDARLHRRERRLRRLRPRRRPTARCSTLRVASEADAVSEPRAGESTPSTGGLLDVLLCRPDNFRWLPTSAISRATLESGRRFDAEAAADQHAELVAAYEAAGVRCHFLEPDPALPYQVFARDSSVMTPVGPGRHAAPSVVAARRVRTGDPLLRGAGIPVFRMVTAAALEGGDVMIVEPGRVLIGVGESRTQEPAARQLAGWFEESGWEARVEPIPEPLRPHRRADGDPRREAGRRLHRRALGLAGPLAARDAASS